METVYARPEKPDDLDTILYEIGMLNYSYNAIPTTADKHQYMALETFLLHYRNLIRFLSETNKHRNDLGISDFAPANMEAIQAEAKMLDEQYHDNISRYLSHCTKFRARQDIGWPTKEMYLPLRALLNKFLGDIA